MKLMSRERLSSQFVTLFRYNQFAQIVGQTDPEGNVTQCYYYPANNPNGDGIHLTAAIESGPFGYLKQSTRDVLSAPVRDSGTNPPQGDRGKAIWAQRRPLIAKRSAF
jgi:YD repeat-containing protein